MNVYIGVGHGGSDPGACANGFKEKDLTLAISKFCYNELVRHGVTAKLSRATDITFDSNHKITDCNAFGADYCVDIHINAGGGDGCEVYYSHTLGKSKQLAENINKSLIGAGQNSRGIKIKMNSKGNADYFNIIRNVKNSVLVEVAFIDNKADLAQIDETSEQEKFGIAIAHGILAQCGIKVKKNVTISDVRKELNKIAEGTSDKSISDVRKMLNELAGKQKNTTSNTSPAFIERVYKNGSTKENVYKTTYDALNNKNAIGYLDPKESAVVIGRYKSCPVVVYNTPNGKKVGFVKYEGGVSEQNYTRKVWKNGSTVEKVYSSIADCKLGKKSIGSIYKNEQCDCIGIVDGYYVVVYKINSTDNLKVGFVKYNGGIK